MFSCSNQSKLVKLVKTVLRDRSTPILTDLRSIMPHAHVLLFSTNLSTKCSGQCKACSFMIDYGFFKHVE